MDKDQAKPASLTAIEGGRAALEIEALLTIPHDFAKFLQLSRALARPANSQLRVVTPRSPEVGDDAAHRPAPDA